MSQEVATNGSQEPTRVDSRIAPVLGLATVVVSVVVAVLYYPEMPKEMVVGWRLGLEGEVNETLPRLLGVSAVPAASVIVASLFALLRLDSLEDEMEPVKKYYDTALLAVLVVMMVGQIVVVNANL